MPDPIEQALMALRQREAELDAETDRVRRAIASLESLVPSDETQPQRAPSAHDPNRPSVRTMLVNLLDEEDRDWSAAEILAAYRRRGNPVHGKDPSNALRAALADAKKRGMIVATGVGRYKAGKWAALARAEGAESFPPSDPRMDRMFGRDSEVVPKREESAMAT